MCSWEPKSQDSPRYLGRFVVSTPHSTSALIPSVTVMSIWELLFSKIPALCFYTGASFKSIVMAKLYYISLHPTPGYFRHFLIAADSPLDAIHKLNYQMRLGRQAEQKENPNNTHHKITRFTDVINTLRRYKRVNKRKWHDGTVVFQPKCDVREYDFKVACEGHLNMVFNEHSYLWNILPALPIKPIGQEQTSAVE